MLEGIGTRRNGVYEGVGGVYRHEGRERQEGPPREGRVKVDSGRRVDETGLKNVWEREWRGEKVQGRGKNGAGKENEEETRLERIQERLSKGTESRKRAREGEECVLEGKYTRGDQRTYEQGSGETGTCKEERRMGPVRRMSKGKQGGLVNELDRSGRTSGRRSVAGSTNKG